jgi:hypothetical protein
MTNISLLQTLRIGLWMAFWLASFPLGYSGLARGQSRPQEIEREYGRSIAKILTTGRSANGKVHTDYGTGVFVAKGVILTAGHVVGRDSEWYSESGRPDRHVDVFALDEDSSEKKVAEDASVTVHPYLDAALIFVNPTQRRSAEVSFESLDGISTLFAYVWDKSHTVPELRASDVARTDVIASGPGIRLSGLFRQGHSGAPIFDGYSRVVGIIVKGDDSEVYTLAIPLSTLAEFLRSAPGFAETRRFRASLRGPFPFSPRDGSAIRIAELTKALRMLREEAARYIEAFFSRRGEGIGPDKAAEIVDAFLSVESEQIENRSSGVIELITKATGTLNHSNLGDALNDLRGSHQAEELRKARERERVLLAEIEQLKDKIARTERGTAEGLAARSSGFSQDLQGKSNELRVNEAIRRALSARSVGRVQEARLMLDELIKEFPTARAARLERGLIEDYEYLVAAKATESTVPYLAVARGQFRAGNYKQGSAVLMMMLQLFADASVVAIQLRPIGLNMGEATQVFLDTLELASKSGIPYAPPWALRDNILVGDGTIFVANHSLMDLSKNDRFDLKFQQFGFAPCILVVRRDERRAGAIMRKTCKVERVKAKIVGTNVVSGVVTLTNVSNHEGTSVEIAGLEGRLTGFSVSVLTDKLGRFQVVNLPDGTRFELLLEHDGYVRRSIMIGLKGGVMTCHEDGRGNYRERGIRPCDLTKLNLRLYPVRQVRIEWILQEQPGIGKFDQFTIKGEAILQTGLPHDWGRGGWSCCKASYKFGPRLIDPPFPEVTPDLLVFTDINGKAFFAHPHGTLARSEVDYDKLLGVESSSLQFGSVISVEDGGTYVLKTITMGSKEESHYVKLKAHFVQ